MARYKAGVSPGLQSLVDKALDKDLETRYQNVESLTADLKREKKFLSGAAQPTMSLPPKPEPFKGKLAQREEPLLKPKERRSRSSTLLWLGIGAAVVMIIVYLMLQNGDASGTIRVQAFLDGRVYIDDNFIDNIAGGETREYDQSVGSHKVEVRGVNETVMKTVTVTKDKPAAETFRPKPAAAPIETRPTPKYSLRSLGRDNLSAEAVKNMLKQYDFYCGEYSSTKDWNNPQGRGMANEFELQADGKIILDRATGMMWQQSRLRRIYDL